MACGERGGLIVLLIGAVFLAGQYPLVLVTHARCGTRRKLIGPPAEKARRLVRAHASRQASVDEDRRVKISSRIHG